MIEIWADEDYVRKLPALLRKAKRTIRLSLYVAVAGGKPAKKSSRLLIDHLLVAAKGGVECLVLLNMVARGSYLKTQNLRTIVLMRRHGIQTRQLTGSRCNHAKAVLIDAKYAVIGSHNWSPSSLRRNHEASMVTDDPAAVTGFVEHFDHLWSTAIKLRVSAASGSAEEPAEEEEEEET